MHAMTLRSVVIYAQLKVQRLVLGHMPRNATPTQVVRQIPIAIDKTNVIRHISEAQIVNAFSFIQITEKVLFIMSKYEY